MELSAPPMPGKKQSECNDAAPLEQQVVEICLEAALQ